MGRAMTPDPDARFERVAAALHAGTHVGISARPGSPTRQMGEKARAALSDLAAIRRDVGALAEAARAANQIISGAALGFILGYDDRPNESAINAVVDGLNAALARLAPENRKDKTDD
jgi:hypothetical protein